MPHDFRCYLIISNAAGVVALKYRDDPYGVVDCHDQCRKELECLQWDWRSVRLPDPDRTELNV